MDDLYVVIISFIIYCIGVVVGFIICSFKKGDWWGKPYQIDRYYEVPVIFSLFWFMTIPVWIIINIFIKIANLLSSIK